MGEIDKTDVDVITRIIILYSIAHVFEYFVRFVSCEFVTYRYQ